MAIYIRDLCSKYIKEVLTVLREFRNYTGLAAIVKSALVNLGYQRTAAEKAVSAAAKNGSFEATFRQALGALSK